MAIIEKGPNSSGAYVPDLPGCVVAGMSRDEVVRRIKEAIQLHFEGPKAEGASIPQPNSETEYINISAA